MRSLHAVAITAAEQAVLDMLENEPALVENLRKCTAAQPHERAMLERLRTVLIRAVGAQRSRLARRAD